MSDSRKDATSATKAANQELLRRLPFANTRDFDDAQRGFIAPLPHNGVIKNSRAETIWDVSRFDKLINEETPSPETVNPSLWRQSQLTNLSGLFKVTDRLYQVRNADLSNLTILEGDSGIIVFDPLISTETAHAALELYFEHRPRKGSFVNKDVKAVLYSHSHVDHFGGVRGVVSEDDVQSGNTIIVAPLGFLEAAVTENVLAGNVMARRASYMYGNLLPVDGKGQVGAGLGMTTSSGTVSLIPPTHIIKETGQRMNIDGLDFEFMMAPESEAPAEMHWYIEQLKAVTAAENCCHVLHNVYTLRGAKIRDALIWSKHLDKTIRMWGHKSELMYGMHHWPVWGQERVLEMLKKGRDGYRFINDQTLRLANHGYNPVEIAEMLKFPPELDHHWAMRGYYGSLNHNVKATYVKYLGYFDGNPALLHQHPPVEAAKRYVEFMGGADEVLKKAKCSFDKGDYRWVAEVVNHVIFADPSKEEARNLQADALEQLGYQAESGPWRNFYLTGAKELREGVKQNSTVKTASADLVKAMDLGMFFDFLGVRLNGEKAAGKKLIINVDMTDTGEHYVLNLENSALTNQANAQSEKADVTLVLGRKAIINLIMQKAPIMEQVNSGDVKIDGSPEALLELVSLLEKFEFWFNIVEPRK